VSDSFEEMKIRSAEHQFNFPYLYDGRTQQVSLAYGPVSTPHAFIFDKQRKLRYAGAIDNTEKPKDVKKNFVRDALDALLQGQEVAVKQTRTFGCSIKWAGKREWVKKGLDDWAREPVEINLIDPNAVRTLMKNDSGKLRLVNVWATWCGPCVIEIPELVAINRMYRGRPFEMVTISADTPSKKDNVVSFLKDKQVSCKNYLFNSEDKAELFDAVDNDWQGGFPYTLLVKPGGEIIFRHPGPIDPLELKKTIVAHLGRYYF
jgi:thiol-disulfide isomerase/thioredoxin